jgi:hypothetical protein
MSPIDYPELENRAAAMVVDELAALQFEKRDIPGAPPSTHDFDIVFADGRTEPLEVTTNLDTTVMKALHRADGGVFELEANVRRLWMVSGTETFTDATGAPLAFDRERVSALLPPLIEQLEHEAETSLDVARLGWPIAYGAPAHHRQAALELHALGITHGGSLEVAGRPDVKPGISVHLGGGVSWGPDTLTTVLEEIAARPDNIANLDAHRAAQRRHLFVALAGAGSTDRASWPLQQFLDGDWIWSAEPRLPNLHDAITTIWASTRTGGIYATPPDGWRRFGTAQR